MTRLLNLFLVVAFFGLTLTSLPLAAREGPREWFSEWPNTDFSRHAVDFDEIISGGPPRGGIPAIMEPHFKPAGELLALTEQEPVIGLQIEGDWRAYPLRILMRHEIVNDIVAGRHVAVTYCPLCNSAVVVDRRLDGQVLTFNTTGKLRLSDMVMFDLETESWWQQFTGKGIVGELTDATLTKLPARLESFALFKERAAAAGATDPKVLVPTPGHDIFRSYGRNPYVGYDKMSRPPLYDGSLPEGIEPLARVVVIGDEAWPMQRVREHGPIRHGDLIISWRAGQRSVLDTRDISRGREVGNIIVQRETSNGLEDVVHDVSFAFAFHAFNPEGTLHLK